MTESLQQMLLSIATGDPIAPRVNRGTGFVYGPFAEGLCKRGVVEVESRPGEHPGLWEELQTTIARLSRVGSPAGAGARPAETAVPYHRRASEVAYRLGNSVSTWARVVAEENPELELAARTIPDAARWLAHWLEVFPSLQVEHREMRPDILGAVSAAKRVIDRAPDRVYAGPCWEQVDDESRCEGQLYAKVSLGGEPEPFVRCRDCGTKHDTEVRQEWLSRALADQLVSAVEAAPVLCWLLGKKITGNNIAAWKRDGRVAVHEGRWPYRFGDLLVLARDMKTRKREGSAA